MYSSSIEICNSALTKIGAEPIVGFTDNTKTSDVCKLRYDACRRAVLRTHPWNGLTKRITLSPNATAPDFGWGQAFDLPTDCLRPLEVNENLIDFTIEGRQILCNDSSIQLRYIQDNPNVTQYDDLLAEAIACRLAWDIAYQITQSITLRDDAYKAYIIAVREAKTTNAQEKPAPEVTADLFLESRLAGTGVGAVPRRNWPASGYPL